jgi:hypothetical protein
MKVGYTDITVLLDRSGSMGTIKDDTIGGFNSFLEEQRKVPGEATISLVQFDDKYEPNYTAIPIDKAQPLCDHTYEPRGWTALLDALGKTVKGTGERYSGMPEDQRPEKVIFVIITDGQENHSKEFTGAQIREMVKHQTEVYKWTFLYLGANVDAFAEARSIGIASTYAANFGATGQCVRAAYKVSSKKLTDFRRAVNGTPMAFFDPNERAALMDEEEEKKP